MLVSEIDVLFDGVRVYPRETGSGGYFVERIFCGQVTDRYVTHNLRALRKTQNKEYSDAKWKHRVFELFSQEPINQEVQQMDVKDIARVCHEANRAYCVGLGDLSQVPWDEAPEWQRASAVDGVNFVLDNLTAPSSASHDNWLELKRAEGWKYGPVKDPDKKEHPCFVPYEELPYEQRVKDSLFKAVVLALSGTIQSVAATQ